MTNPFGEWGLMDRIILRECEFRVRNADALRSSLSKKLKLLAATKDQPWEETRSIATECLVEAEALVAEYAAIAKEVMATNIPANEADGHRRRNEVALYAEDAHQIMQMAPDAIRSMIAEEDERLTSSRPSSTSE